MKHYFDLFFYAQGAKPPSPKFRKKLNWPNTMHRRILINIFLKNPNGRAEQRFLT